MNNENEKENALLYEVIDPIYMGIRIRNLIRMYNKMYHREVISEHDTPKIERQLKHEILCNCHEFHPYKEKKIYDEHSDKVRILHVPHIRDRIYESVIMQIVEPAFSLKWTGIPFASITGKGLTLAIAKMRRAIGCGDIPKKRDFALKLDIVKYYRSIDHTLMHKTIDKHFANDRIIGNNLHSIVDSHSPGLPIGTYSSQFLANLFLSDLDYACAHINHTFDSKTIRYMDDILAVCNTYDQILYMQDFITNWCNDHLLNLHEPIIVDFTENDHTNSIKCIGMLFSHKGVFLTPESKIRITQQYQDIVNHIKSDSVTQTDLGQAAAMNGWLSNSTDQTFKNQLKIKDLIQTLKEILDRRDINDRQWNYSIQ